MAVQQETFVYTINTLLHLGRTLPKLRCNIAKFNAYAFEGMFVPPALPRRLAALCAAYIVLAQLLFSAGPYSVKAIPQAK